MPPEINSALIYAGAGSGPLHVAAAAWDGLAADLSSAATSFQSVVSGLLGGTWSGPASLEMAATATPYIQWLGSAAAQAEAAAAQARVAASAFESALSATVPTAAVTTNRTQLLSLIATNIFGQNTPAIAGTEFEYMDMWAADVAAMFGYHTGALTAASAMPALSVPPVLAGLGSEATSLLSSTGLAGPLSTVGALVASEGSTLLAQPSVLLQGITTPISLAMSPMMMAIQAATSPAKAAAGLVDQVTPDAAKFVDATSPAMKGVGGLGVGGLGGLGGAEAGLGKSRLVGAMSVPPTWQGSSPARMASAAMSGLGTELGAAGAMATGAAGGMQPMPMPMPMGGGGAGMPGGMMGRGGASPNHVTQQRPSVVPRTGVG